MLTLDGTLIIAMISFIIFAFIMNEVLYKPILNIIEERNNYFAKNAKSAEAAENMANELSLQKEEELSSVRSIAKKSVEEGNEKIKNEAKIVINDFMKNQRENTQRQRDMLEQEVEISKQELSNSADAVADLISDKVLGFEVKNV